MKISLNWAKHWTSVPDYNSEALEKFSHTFTTYTAEVEGIDTYIFDDRIVVGKVLSWKPHPDSDKLGLVDVDAGSLGLHTIVCGALNAKTSAYVPVALEHAILPNGLEIGRREIRGVESCGMICSLDELGLQSERADGIFPLETVWNVAHLEKNLGKPIGSLTLAFPGHGGDIEYALNDVVFDLDNKFITNRPDLFSVVGNAREIACIEKKDFSFAPSLKDEFEGGGNKLRVSIESDKVINYLLTEYTLESIAQTPLVLKVLLKRSNQGLHGMLPDITNVVLTELGQPSHVFDADKIKGTIRLRMALEGEKVEALDGKMYTLTTEDLVIADDEKILTIAGVIGAMSSGATAETRHIIIETATFDPVAVRKTSQRLGVRTDSSIRFEKGTDLTLPVLVQDRIEQFLQKYTTGLKKMAIFSYSTEKPATMIEVSHAMLERKIGTQVSSEQVVDILTRLGFRVNLTSSPSPTSRGESDTEISNESSQLGYSVTVPSWRDTGDVSISEDIVEEVARQVGYDMIVSQALPGPLSLTKIQTLDSLTRGISRYFAGRGYHDVYTYPFTLDERFRLFSDSEPAVIRNTSENRTHLRAHMAESLLELVSSHYRRYDQGAFFEFGPIFDGPEKLQGVGISWGKPIALLQADISGYIETFFGEKAHIVQGTSDSRLFAPNASSQYLLKNSTVVLRFGRIRPTLLPYFDIENLDVYAFEIVAMPPIHRPISFVTLSEFPGTERELNFIMPEETPVAVVTGLVSESHDWISDVGVNEIYRDENHIGKNKKSVVVSFLIQNPKATITDEEAAVIQESVIKKLAEAGYMLRGV